MTLYSRYRLIFLLTLVLFGTTKNAQTQDIHPPKVLSYNSFVNIGSNKWIDVIEICVMNWMEYIFYNNIEFYSSEVYPYISITTFDTLTISQRLLPDKNLIKDYQVLFEKTTTLGSGGIYRDQKLPVPKDRRKYGHYTHDFTIYGQYSDTPIVGITYEQALDYCKWRTKRDSAISVQNGFHYWYVYRLPTPEELDQLNSEMDSISYHKNKKKSGATFNYKNAKYRLFPSKNEKNYKYFFSYYGIGEAPIDVINFRDELTKLHHIQGNVSEMTSIKGVAKGESFINYASECKRGSKFIYTKPESWLGFRCIAQLRLN